MAAFAARAQTRLSGFKNGRGNRARTDDIHLVRVALYQLSYAPIEQRGPNLLAERALVNSKAPKSCDFLFNQQVMLVVLAAFTAAWAKSYSH